MSSGKFPNSSNFEETSHVPPMLTKTWFHTGAFIERGKMARYFEHEYYYDLDRQAFLNEKLDDAKLYKEALGRELTAEEVREASRALKGSLLRQGDICTRWVN